MMSTATRLCGLATPLSGILSLWLAVSSSPWFRLTQEDLSVLGVAGTATGFFNWGLALTGLLSAAFASGLGNGLRSGRLLKLGMASLVAGSVGLAMVGLVPRIYSLPHRLASGAFFALVPLAMFIVGLSLLRSGRRFWGWSSVAAAALMVGLQLAPWPWPGGAIPQLLSSMPWWFWTAAMGLKDRSVDSQ